MANLSTQSGTNSQSPHRPTPRHAVPQQRSSSNNKSGTSGEDTSDDDDEIVDVVTRPGTPMGGKTRGAVSGGGKSVSANNTKDPIRILPTVILVRIFLQLDIRSLARCDRVCKRWHKSSNLNYIWFLHTRSLTLPSLTSKPTTQTSQSEDPDAFDPYDRRPTLSLSTPLPTSSTPQWSKRESKSAWKNTFKALATRREDDVEPGSHLQVDVDALSSGYVTPQGHTYAGMGSGSADRWSTPAGNASGNGGGDNGIATPPKSKKEMREVYKSMGGRKVKGKGKMGGELKGHRDKEGMGGKEDIYEAPW